MRSLPILAFVAGAALAGGCIIDNSHPEPPPYERTCAQPTSYTIDTGATLSYGVGVDAGYYSAYAAGGHWHFEWTCDTKYSAYGCNFVGTIIVDKPAGGSNATCYMCEPNQDVLTVTSLGAQDQLDFNTLTSTGIDGVDFYGVPGHSIHVDLSVDGHYENDIVFIPSGGVAANPACMPIDLVPSAP